MSDSNDKSIESTTLEETQKLNDIYVNKDRRTRNITEYLEDVFGWSKTYHDWTGEIAKVRQNKDETVVIYLNKMKEIIKEMKKSARREKRLTAETEHTFSPELDKDCLKFFLRGICFDIRARMGTPKTFEEVFKIALETKKAFALDQIDNDVPYS